MAELSCHAMPRLRMQDHPVYSGNDPAGRLPDARFFPFSAELSASPDARTRFPSLGRALRFTVVAHPVYAADAFAISIPWKLQGESQSADRFHKIVSHPIMAIGRSLLEAAPALFLLYYLGL
ncbi:MAG: hypothetical protein ACLR8L_11255 [Oscillospiraceae bacterium]